MWKAARVVPGAGEVIGRVCTLDYTRPGKPRIDWDDPAAKQQLVSDLFSDALAVLDELAGPGAPARDAAAADALGQLALVAGQDVASRRKDRTGRTGGGGSPGRWPRTGHLDGGHPGQAHLPVELRVTGIRAAVAYDQYALPAPSGAGELRFALECHFPWGIVNAAKAGIFSAAQHPGTGDDAASGGAAVAGAEAEQGAGLKIYGDSAYGSGEARAAYPRRRPRHGHQAQAAAARRARRVHPRRLHR